MKDRNETGNVVQRLIAAAAIFFLMTILHVPLGGEEVDLQEAPGPLFAIKTDGALGDAVRHIE
ncbi:MAG: hypothetical protein JW884_03030, partial [Deltaproteobacteria bacterium]|nr:hypothetical protein [Deltaproteobacteria bacterium]